MQQYAVHRLRESENYAIVLQYGGLETSSLVIVAPLIKASLLPEIAPITPVIRFDDQEWMVLTYRMAAVAEHRLGKKITVVKDQDYLFHRALSRLFYGN